MAVYTVLDEQTLRELTARFDAGRLLSFSRISEGIENSNYLIAVAQPGAENTRKEYVLTIAESQNLQDIEFIARLTNLLRDQGLPVPAPIANAHGQRVLLIEGKPCVLVPRIEGRHPLHPSVRQCEAIGIALGRLHAVTLASGLRHPGHRSLDWLMDLASQVRGELTHQELDLLDREVAAAKRLIRAGNDLPKAIIHGDLFRDNTLFLGDQLIGIIDFFSAGDGFLLFDLAVVANDWCTTAGHRPDPTKTRALLTGYASRRPPLARETGYWNDFLRLAALRFWVSRLAERQKRRGAPATGAFPTGKNPSQYKDILLGHTLQPSLWPLG